MDRHSLTLELTVEDDSWIENLPVLFDGRDHGPSDRLIDTALLTLDRIGNLPSETVCLAILLADDARLAELNGQFRGKPKPTNVLSFPDGSDQGAEGGTYLGDLALARETVFREAADQGKSALDHTLHLVVHGILHLLGYDHDTDRAALEMETLERHILADLGIADPYQPENPAIAGVPGPDKGPRATESTAFSPRR